MSVTVSLIDLAVFLGLATLVTGTVFFVRLAMRVSRTADRLDRSLDEIVALAPHARVVLDESTRELQALHTVTVRSADVVDDLQGITKELRHGVAVLDLAKRSHAVVAGAKAGLSVLRNATD